MFEVLLHRLRRNARCLWLTVLGWWQYRRGQASRDLTMARSTFERLVSLRWTSFYGHLHLGLIADHLGRRSHALEELAVAYRLDAARFRRAPIPKTLREQVLWRETATQDRPPLVLGMPEAVRERRPQLKPHVTTSESLFDAGPTVAAGTDFNSLAEVRRFAELPPILPEDVAETDMDALMERLFEGE